MIINEYKLQDFKTDFNNKLRKPTKNELKFKALKKELNEHLSKFGKTIKDLENLKIFVEGNSLCFSYREDTNQDMLIRLMWRINELGPKDILNMVKKFATEDLKIETKPRLNISNGFMYQNLALYWPKQKQIDISMFTVNQLEEEEVLKLVKHEMIHYYLDIEGKNPSDTSSDFIEMVIIHDAYVSLEEEASRAYKIYKQKNKK